MFKLFSIDTRGTLLDSNYDVSIENIEAIKQAKMQGSIVCISTRDNFKSSIDIAKQVDADYIIYNNGCFVKNVKTNKYAKNIFISFLQFIIYSMFPYTRLTDKYYGVRHLCRKLSIPLSQTVAIGDSVSDFLSIKKCGLGIGVLGCGFDILFYSDYVTKKDCNNSAVADAIYYALSKKTSS